MATGRPHSSTSFIEEDGKWQRLKSARQHRREQQKEEQHLSKTPKESFSTKQFGVEVRRQHNQEYHELAAQLNDMKQMQNDVKSQLAGLQTLAKRISEKKTSKTSSATSNSNHTDPSGPKKQN